MAVLFQMLQLAIKHTGERLVVTLHLPPLPTTRTSEARQRSPVIHYQVSPFVIRQAVFEIVLALTLLLSSTQAVV